MIAHSDASPPQEEWRQVVGYQRYEVSNFGRVRSVRTKRVLAQAIRGTYLRVILYTSTKPRKHKTCFVHKLVLAAFVGEKPSGFVRDHIDRNKLNNSLSNLRYCLPRDNSRNCVRRKRGGRTASVYRGVRAQLSGKFDARICNGDGKSQYLGTFNTAEEAARAYDAAALSLHGAFATLNFPTRTTT